MTHEHSWFEQSGQGTLRTWGLDIALNDIIRMQSAEPETVIQRNPVLLQTAERALMEGASLLDPAVVYRALQVVQLRHERLVLETGFEIRSKLLSEHLKSAQHVVAAVCTIGFGVEQLAKEEFKQNPVYGLALEGLGSAAVETLATEFCALVERHAVQAGMSSSIPLSPGMVGWPVGEGQQHIFKLLDARTIGVELTASSMMRPAKTISLILGVGEDMNAEGSTCDYCSMRERCQYRDHYLHVET